MKLHFRKNKNNELNFLFCSSLTFENIRSKDTKIVNEIKSIK